MPEESKNLVGRPKKYTDEVLSDLAKKLRKWVDDHVKEHKFGMLKHWCFVNDFNPKYFGVYAPEHEEFGEAYEWAKEWQEYIVAHDALTQKLNARFAQFFLGCCHHWRTKDPGEDKKATLRNDFGRFMDYMDSLDEGSDNGEGE